MDVQKVLQQAEKDKIKFVTLQFTDLLGLIKEVVIGVDHLEGACRDGLWFDGSSVEGFARIQESDLFLKPDPLNLRYSPPGSPKKERPQGLYATSTAPTAPRSRATRASSSKRPH